MANNINNNKEEDFINNDNTYGKLYNLKKKDRDFSSIGYTIKNLNSENLLEIYWLEN